MPWNCSRRGQFGHADLRLRRDLAQPDVLAAIQTVELVVFAGCADQEPRAIVRQLASASALQIPHERQFVRWFQGQIGQRGIAQFLRGLQAA